MNTRDTAAEFKLECVVLAAGAPLNMARAAELLGTSEDGVRSAMKALNERNISEGRSYTVEERGAVLIAQTRAPFAELVKSLKESRTPLTPALLQTLAVVAYRQPVTRAEVDTLRGVDCGYSLGRLLRVGLIRTAGRADKPGRPLLYRTTERFLVHFGLSSLRDLPSVEELGAMMESSEASEGASAPPEPPSP